MDVQVDELVTSYSENWVHCRQYYDFEDGWCCEREDGSDNYYIITVNGEVVELNGIQTNVFYIKTPPQYKVREPRYNNFSIMVERPCPHHLPMRSYKVNYKLILNTKDEIELNKKEAFDILTKRIWERGEWYQVEFGIFGVDKQKLLEQF